MSLFEAIFLGLVQGLTEFIPVSSSGHLVVAQAIFGRAPEHLLLEFINIGTVLALVIYFWAKIAEVAGDIAHGNWRLGRNIILSALPAGVIGLFLADFIDQNRFFSSEWVVAFALITIGVIMIVSERLPRLSAVRDGSMMSSGRAAGIGLAQVLALVPGVSRSGSTILAGRVAGMTVAKAAEYSFLLSIPLMLGVVAKLLLKTSDRDYMLQNWGVVLASNLAAFVSGLVAIGFLMRYLERRGLAAFGWYRVVLGTLIIGGLCL